MVRLGRPRIPSAQVVSKLRGTYGLVWLTTAIGCDNTTLPGTQLGTYGVTGSQTSNACGSGVANPGPTWTFTASMSEDGTTLYWNDPVDGTLSGTLVGSTASMSNTVEGNVDGTNGVMGPCNMETVTDLAVTLGSGSPPSTFTGTITYTFSALAGSNCSDQLAANGGSYLTLPCAFAYSLAGSLQ